MAFKIPSVKFFILLFTCFVSTTISCECENLKEEFQELKKELKALKQRQTILENLNHVLMNKRKSGDILLTDLVDATDKRFVLDGELNVEEEVRKLMQDVQRLQHASGSTYVRWGRTTCPTNATEVYKGFTGGNYYTHSGGAGNYLCLPDDPTWAKYVDGIQSFGGKVYGTEYENDYGANNVFSQYIDDEDAPCVVCKIERQANIMIPARTNCYPGWNLEYTGYLMSMGQNYTSASEYICVDGSPEVTMHGHQNENGDLLYVVEAVCGSLPCLPYVDGRELACVVCSK